MARPRTGSLVWRKSGWRARISVIIDGETVQKTYDLGTIDKAVARRKMARLLEETEGDMPAAELAKAPETVDGYASEWLTSREARADYGKTERQIFRDYWQAEIGPIPLGAVRPADIRRVLKDCAEGRKLGARGERLTANTIDRVRGVMFRLFKAARKDELIAANPAELVTVSDVASPDDKKERAILTDAEIGTLLASPIVDLEIKMLVLLSRTIGGMRAGDLNTLDWTAFGEGFATCRVPRRKTRKRRKAQELDVPEQVRPFIDAWWQAAGCPTSGPMFPVRRGPRAGEQKKHRNISYAARLRRELRRAMGLEWWDDDAQRWDRKRRADYSPRERELFIGSPDTLPVDFHSCRRAFATALASAGAQAPQLQALGGWSDPKVAQGYVRAASIRSAPAAAALPAVDAGVLARSVQKPRKRSRKNSNDSTVPRVRIELTTRGFSDGGSGIPAVFSGSNHAQSGDVTPDETGCDAVKHGMCINSVLKPRAADAAEEQRMPWSTAALVALVELASAAAALPAGALARNVTL